MYFRFSFRDALTACTESLSR